MAAPPAVPADTQPLPLLAGALEVDLPQRLLELRAPLHLGELVGIQHRARAALLLQRGDLRQLLLDLVALLIQGGIVRATASPSVAPAASSTPAAAAPATAATPPAL